MSSGPLRIVALAACTTLILSGGVPAGAAIGAAVLIAWGRRWPALPWVWAHVAVIVGAGATVFALGTVEGFSILVSWLLAHRIGTARGASDERLGLLLAILVVLLGTLGSVSVVLFPALVAVGVASPAVLLRAEGIDSRRLERTTAIAGVLTATALFLVLPRLQGGLMQGAREPGGTTSFPDSVAIGDETEDGDDNELVMRVRPTDAAGRPVPGPIYMQGRVLDQFDGTRWTSVVNAPRSPTTGTPTLITEVLLEPIGGDVLFGPPDILRMEGFQEGVGRNAAGDWVRRSGGQRVAYRALSVQRSLDAGIWPTLPAYTQLPTLDPAVRAIADAVAPQGAGAIAVINGTLAYLRDGFTYQENPPPPEGDPLAWFLTKSKSGHCEYYASAAAVILRARGVPARLATGFYSSETSDAGGYIAVRRGHAHAWVEVPIRAGWVVVDPSPVQSLPKPQVSWFTDMQEAFASAWYSLVLDYDLDKQLSTVERIGANFATPVAGDPVRSQTRAGMAGFAVVFVALFGAGTVLRIVLFFLARPARPATVAPLVAVMRAGRAAVVRRGWALPAELPAQDAAAWLRAQAGEDAAPFEALVALVYAGHYGGGEPSLSEAQALLAEIRRMPKPGARRSA